jgi:dienelactone hydrolase
MSGGAPSRPSRRLGALLAALLALALLAGCTLPRPAGQGPLRYRDAIFTGTTKTSNLQYGSAPNAQGNPVSLLLDLYEPAGDSEDERAALVWVHGGGFSGGDKGSGVAPDAASVFTKLGYVVVSINYRLTTARCGGASMPPECTLAAIDAQHDAQAAVRWLRARADTYDIDPTRIAIGGESAGGITATLVGLRKDDPGSSGNPGHRSDVGAFISLSGGVPNGVFAGAGDAAGLFFHNESDPVVPSVWSTQTFGAMLRAGLPAFIHWWPGTGHVAYVANRDFTLAQSQYFLYHLLDLGHASGQPAPAARAAERQVDALEERYSQLAR